MLGCGGEQTERERAIEDAKEKYDYAVRQGVDLKRTPCIGVPAIENWLAVVHFGPASTAEQSARRCPGYGVDMNHFVALDPQGDLVVAR
jgi:hypothetical protein